MPRHRESQYISRFERRMVQDSLFEHRLVAIMPVGLSRKRKMRWKVLVGDKPTEGLSGRKTKRRFQLLPIISGAFQSSQLVPIKSSKWTFQEDRPRPNLKVVPTVLRSC